MIWTFLAILVLVAVGGALFLQHPSFGKRASGERLERIKKSPNYREGIFQNQSATPMLVGNKSRPRTFLEFFFVKVKDLRPSHDVAILKTDLTQFDREDEFLIWLGHSSLYLQTNGKRILVDPVLISASPVSFINKAFSGTDGYHPDDIPDIDYLLLTHDHWDHLDYRTMLAIRERVQQVICPLGVGAHLEYWGVAPARITEVDWYDKIELDGEIKLTSIPARHFSGRGLSSNGSLWTGYMLQSNWGNIYLSGDTGYDTHFEAVKREFGTIDLAIMENGQYNEQWRYIHIMPEDLVKAVNELQPKTLMTVHNSKYALGKHAWTEPMDKIWKAAQENRFNLITPMIGEPVYLKDSTQIFKNWWSVM